MNAVQETMVWATTLPKFNGIESEFFAKVRPALLKSANGILPLLPMLAMWKHCGWPTVSVTEEFFAAMAATSAVAERALPFDAFVIKVPRLSDESRLEFVIVANLPTGPSYSMYWSDGGSAFCVSNPVGVSRNITGFNWTNSPRLRSKAEYKREIAVVGRAVRAMITYMTQYKPSPVGKHRQGGEINRKTGLPFLHEFSLGKNVVHGDSMSAALSKYLAGNGRIMTKRFMVMGHMRNQPYGPDGSTRRLIWIKPYWKGNLENPILIRDHVYDNHT